MESGDFTQTPVDLRCRFYIWHRRHICHLSTLMHICRCTSIVRIQCTLNFNSKLHSTIHCSADFIFNVYELHRRENQIITSMLKCSCTQRKFIFVCVFCVPVVCWHSLDQFWTWLSMYGCVCVCVAICNHEFVHPWVGGRAESPNGLRWAKDVCACVCTILYGD